MIKGHSIILTTVLLAGLWWLLTGGQPESWLIGIPAIFFASWVLWLMPADRGSAISLIAVLRFLPLFVYESLRGGVAVARRVLVPTINVRAEMVRYHTCLQGTTARVFFVICINLLPGTLVAEMSGANLRIHLLNADSDALEEVRTLERIVARIFRDTRRVEKVS